MNLYEQTQAFSAELLTNERRAASAMVRSYSTAYSAIQSEIGNMQRRIATARAAGLDVSPAWLYQQGRLAVLQAQVLEQITKFGERADIILGGSINTASALGGTHAEALLATALPDGIAISPAMDPVRVGGAPTAAASSPFVAVVAEEVSLATGAIEKLTGALQPDAAVGRLLAQLGPDAAQAVTQALVQGLALGKNPQVVANGMRDALGGNLTRALTIARTETLRAYREASRATFTANASVLDGWTWVSALGKRTCASCFAQHGSVHPLTEVMATHPRCRCSMAPAPKSYRELGYGDTPESVKIEKGPDIFRRLPVDEQRATLGPGKLAALRSNGITLPDLVARKDSPVWGPGTSEASLAAARRNAAARRRGATNTAPPIASSVAALAPTAGAVPDMTDLRSLEKVLLQTDQTRTGVVEFLSSEIGFDGAPRVLSNPDFEKWLQDNGVMRIYRGINGGDGAARTQISLDLAEQYRTGKMHTGKGIYGAGTYAGGPSRGVSSMSGSARAAAEKAGNESGLGVAQRYAGTDGTVMQMAIRPDAVVANWEDAGVKAAYKEWREKVERNLATLGADGEGNRAALSFSVWAMSNGFDAFEIPTRGYHVILNRTKAVVDATADTRPNYKAYKGLWQ